MTSEDVGAEYASSLADLTLNSKPLINMLTILAEENVDHASAIVAVIEKHLNQARPELKLPALYLVDSIVKNIGGSYVSLFTVNIVSTFCSVFEKVDESTRASMFKLRQTWNDVFPPKKLYALDVRVKSIDPAWPITAPPPTSIHVNPAFISKQTPAKVEVAAPAVKATEGGDLTEIEMRENLLRKQKELLELQQKKLELELLQTKARLNQPILLPSLPEVKKLEEALKPAARPVTPEKPKVQMVKPTPTVEAAAPLPPVEVKPLPEEIVPPKPPAIGSLAGLRRSESPEKKTSSGSGSKRKESRKDKDSRKDSDREKKRSRKDSDRSGKKEGSPRSKKEADGGVVRKSRAGSTTGSSDDESAHVKVEASHLRNHREAAKAMPRIPKLSDRNPAESRDPRLHKGAEARKAEDKKDEPVEARKRKAHVMTDLFGSEDVDLRQITAAAAAVPPQAPVVARSSPPPGPGPTWPHKKRPAFPPSHPPARGRGGWHRGRGRGGPPPPQRFEPAPWRSPGDDSWEGPSTGEDGSGSPRNMDIILGQAEEQHRNGLIDDSEYQTVIKQVFHINESKMIREAQRRESLEPPPRDQDSRFFPGHARDYPPAEGPWHPPRGPRDPRRPGFGPHGFRPRLDGPFRGGPGPMPPGPPLRGQGPPGFHANEVRPDEAMKTINIDNIPREIRFYDEVGVIMMADDDPRDLTFQPTVRNVYIDGVPFECRVGDGYRDFHFDGTVHRVKLGAPTRELIIDGQWYECIFGGAPVSVNIGGRVCTVALEGPPPTVNIGTERRLDLVAGRINMVIDAQSVIPVYLDLKPQYFQMMGRTYTLQFQDALRTVVIDGNSYRADFGGLPFAVSLAGRKHFMRFAALPRGIEVGQVLKPQTPASFAPSAIPVEAAAAAAPAVAAPPDVSSLLQKLMASGLLPTATKPATEKPATPAKVEETVTEIDFTPESLRKRQSAVVSALYSGMQCGSCGLRFPAEQTIRYSAHLDWHFRQNRREKGAAKRPQSRRWYYDLSDWIQYEEMENADEKRQNWFDSQASEKGRQDESSEGEDSYSVPAGLSNEENRCAVCNEDLEQFFNEESEEWHLRDAVRIDNVTYHRLCYRDYQTSLEAEAAAGDEDTKMEVEAAEVENDASNDSEDTKDSETIKGIKTEPIDEEMSPAPPEEPVKVESKEEPALLAVEDVDKETLIKEEPSDTVENTAHENGDVLNGREDSESPVAQLSEADEALGEEVASSPILERTETKAPVVISSIDGNVEFNTAPAQPLPTGPFKINLNFSSKASHPSTTVQQSSPPVDSQVIPEIKPEETTPAPEESNAAAEVELDEKAIASKPRFAGRKFTVVPLQSKGSELSGLCSIM